MWYVTKIDICKTLARVCKRVTHDHSVDEATRYKRKLALYCVGDEFETRGLKSAADMKDFIDRMVQQGPFSAEGAGGNNGTDGSNEKKPADGRERNFATGGESSGAGGAGDAGEWGKRQADGLWNLGGSFVTLDDLKSLSVKELKVAINKCGGNHSQCVEKKDLQRCLYLIFFKQMSVEEMKNKIFELSLLKNKDPTAVESLPELLNSIDNNSSILQDMLLELLEQE